MAHKSWLNLKPISSNLTKILAQSDEPTTDWLQNKRIHMGNYGFLDLAVNSPLLWDEIEKIIKLVKSFNESRNKVISFKNTILSHHINSGKRLSISKFPSARHSNPRSIKNLSNPSYNDKTFERISIQAFLSDHIRKVLSTWENDKK